MNEERYSCSTTIVGGGPASLALLIAASNAGTLDKLLAHGLVIIERGEALGAGGLRGIIIRSDSAAYSFIQAIQAARDNLLRDAPLDPLLEQFMAAPDEPVALSLVVELLTVCGTAIEEYLVNYPNCHVLTKTEVMSAKQNAPGWLIRASDNATQQYVTISSENLVIAAGGRQSTDRLFTESSLHQALLPRYAHKILQSDQMLKQGGVEKVIRHCREVDHPLVAIIGGSSSAAAVAQLLTNNRLLGLAIPSLTTVLVHRSPMRLFYQSADEARRDRYEDYNCGDICPLTGRIHRFGGLRFDSRSAIVKSISRVDEDTARPLFCLSSNELDGTAIRDTLERSTLIVTAIGYLPRLIPLFNQQNQRIYLKAETTYKHNLVNEHSQVLGDDGRPISGLFAIGLASGRPWTPELGGESDFVGQINSLWMWQNVIGAALSLRLVRNLSTVRSDAGWQDGDLSVPSPIKRKEPSLAGQVGLNRIDLIQPRPTALTLHFDKLKEIERSNQYTNFGPKNTAFEGELVANHFRDGDCVTVCNATIGLILAIKEAVGSVHGKRYALMPSFTFTAAAQAALWCGLTPLFCDVDPDTWLPSEVSELEAFTRHEGKIAVVVPNATFGNCLDLAHYEAMSIQFGVPVVVDAAAAFGSISCNGMQFGAGFSGSVVYSMHATKPFSVGEGGFIYSSSKERIAKLRAMSGFGHGATRSAIMLGLNAKLGEVSALSGLLKLKTIHDVVRQRDEQMKTYATLLSSLKTQTKQGKVQAYSFASVLLPLRAAHARDSIMERLSDNGIQTASYFSPHLAQQAYWQQYSESMSLHHSTLLAKRIITLPIGEHISEDNIRSISLSLLEEIARIGDQVTPGDQRGKVHAVRAGHRGQVRTSVEHAA